MSNDMILSIVGKNEIVREGLRRILIEQFFSVCQTTSSVGELSDAALAGENCLVIIDANSAEEGIASCQLLRARAPDARIVLMQDDYSLENVGKALTAGVDGYLVKEIACGPLGGALRLVGLGEKVFPSQIADSLLDPAWKSYVPSRTGGLEGLNLSAREVEILRCLIGGEPNKVISRQLHITEATVKVHVKAILRKLRVRNRTQAAIWAVTRGLDEHLDSQDAPVPHQYANAAQLVA